MYVSDFQLVCNAHLDVIQEAERRADVRTVLEHSLHLLPSLQRLVLEDFAQHPDWPTRAEIALRSLMIWCPRFLAEEQLLRVRGVVNGCRITSLVEPLGVAIEQIRAAATVLARVQAEPGIVQSDLSREVSGAQDHLYWWHRFGWVARERSGRSFRVWVKSSPSLTLLNGIPPLFSRKDVEALISASVERALQARTASQENEAYLRKEGLWPLP